MQLAALVCILAVIASFASAMPRFEGILVARGQSAALICLEDGRSKWCVPGDRIGGYELIKIDRVSEEVTLSNQNGETTRIRISTSTIGKVDITALKPVKALTALRDLDWKWIKSDANPMRQRPEPLPEWAVLAWETSGDDFRTDFLNFYRAHGWELSRVEGKPGGRVRMDFNPLQNPFEPRPATHPAKLRPMQFRDKPSDK